MIRILHVVHGMDCGGTENIIMNLYRNIDCTKVQFDFLVHTEKRCFFDDEIEQLGGCIYHVPYYNILNLFTYKQALRKFFSTHNEWIAVHGHLGSCACFYLGIAKKYGLYTIAHSHAINEKRLNLKELLYRFHAYLTRGVADFYMGCSYEAGVDRYGKAIANSKKYKIINNGIKADDYTFNEEKRVAMRSEFGVLDCYVIGHVGRFSAVKNHNFMLDVLAELKKFNADYTMMFVGDGELRKTIELKAKNMGIADSIVFTGIRKDVPSVLQAMDQFIFPSFNEGLGIGLIEAQAAGLPCIANKDGIISLAKFSNLVEMKSIYEGAQAWASHIDSVRKSNFVRKDMSHDVKAAGFDIVEVTKWLQEFYINIKR